MSEGGWRERLSPCEARNLAITTTHRSPDDIRQALEKLTDVELARLRLKGRLLAPGCGCSGDDLLNEAVMRTLAGDRLCPVDVSFLTFLSNVMRSIADGEREKFERETPAGSGHDEMCVVGQLADGRTAVDRAVVDRIELGRVVSRVEALFSDDKQAMAIVIGDMQGWTPDEIKLLESMSDVEFATARRRVRREIAREFGERRSDD